MFEINVILLGRVLPRIPPLTFEPVNPIMGKIVDLHEITTIIHAAIC